MKDIQLLIKKDDSLGKYNNIYPITYTDAIIDKSSGKTLHEILLSYNMYFLSYTGNTQTTRLKVPSLCRKTGLWITYVKYDKNVYTEWYAGDKIDDTSWLNSSNWRVGNSQLVGDVSISSNGNWIINGEETDFKAIGEKGNTPILKIENNKLLASYNGGTSYINVSDNPVYTIFRWKATVGDSQSNNVGNILASTDYGKTWIDMSEPFRNNLHISKYIGADESLPTSGIPEGTIYAKGPTYAVEDTSNSNPIYRLWVYAWKNNILAWQDNGEFTSIAAGIVQETGSNENAVMSQKATTEAIHEILYDVSANNDGAVFESLQAILSSPNLSTLIPTSVRHGGISIRFVQSSDNKYVQYRLMTDEWSTNTEDWSFCGNDVYVDNSEFIRVVLDNEGKILEAIRVNGTKLLPAGVEINEKIDFEDNKITIIENPEFVEVILDSAGHILWAIKTDGSIYYGAGVPPQIIDYINERIAELSLDEYEDIVAFLNSLEEGDKTLQTLLNEKVDKVEGKSLIDSEYASTKSIIDNPEFLEVTTDLEDKILEGIREDGTKIIGGDTRVLGNMEVSGVSYKVIENTEYLAAWVDAEDNIIFGFKTDGKTYVGDSDFLNDIKGIKTFLQNITNKNIDWDALSTITAIETTEFLEAKTDLEDKLLAGRTPDGVAFENVGFSTPKVFIDGHILENIEDPEGRSEITTDSECKIISYRDADGVKHEDVGIETKEISTDGLKLSERGMTEFHQALINSGFTPGGKSDWSRWFESHKEALELPIPAKAIANITGINDMPTKKLVDYHAEFEYWDRIGNYFKTKVILNAQGSSTMKDPMKSLSVDFCADDWIGDKTFDLKFGNWVVQDGFHLKAFYKDALKSIQPISYTIGENITKHLNVRSNRFHIGKDSTTLYGGTGNIDNDFSEALCHPDQFPVEVYLNGEYYGLFVWSLKKNRKNYSMNKKDYESILVDNVYGMYFSKQNEFDWLVGEIRNPKTLICVDGKKYDADTHMGELIGTDTIAGQTYTFCKLNADTTGTETFEVTSVAYDATNKDMQNTAKTKKIIEDCVAYRAAVREAQTTEEKRALLQQYFDVDNIIAYIIFSELTFNRDGLTNNAQISIFDRKVGYNIYDCDSCLGKWANGLLLSTSLSHEVISSDSQSVLWFIKSCYGSEIASAYKKLRDDKIIDKDTISDIIDEWFDRIGHDAIKRSIEKWTTSPSYRECTNLNVSYWKPVMPMNVNGIERYSESIQYQVGDVIYVAPDNITQSDNYQKNYYECIKNCIGEYPITNGNYTVDGIYDTPMRIKIWIEKRIAFCDNLWNYNV